MDTIQDFPGFIIKYPLALPDDAEDQKRAAARAIASRIAEIHLLAMDANPLLHAQFPTPESLAAVREFLGDSYKEAVLESSRSGDDGTGGILVARTMGRSQPRRGSALRKEEAAAAGEDDDDKEKGDIIGFASWEYTPGSSPSPSPSPSFSVGTEPSSASANLATLASTVKTHDPSSSSGVSGDGDDPKNSNKLETSISQHVPGCQSHYLDEYTRLATQAKAKYFGGGGKECYQLSFVCIDPVYQGKGVGSALTRKVLELAARGSSGTRKSLPVYLESTLPAVRIYQRLGFKEIGSFEMEIPAKTRISREEEEEEEEEGVHSVSTPSTGPTEGLVTTTYKEICMVCYP